MESVPERFPDTVEDGERQSFTEAPSIAEHLAPKPAVTDPIPEATPAEESAGDDPAAGPGTSPVAEDEELPYKLGSWSGLPAVFCRWKLPDGTECNAGFLTEEEFWNHHTEHIIRAMSPEERAAAVLAVQAAQNPSVIVDARGNPIR